MALRAARPAWPRGLHCTAARRALLRGQFHPLAAADKRPFCAGELADRKAA